MVWQYFERKCFNDCKHITGDVFHKKTIRKITYGKKGIRKLVFSVRFVTVIVLFLISCFASQAITLDVNTWEATEAAVVVFHEEVKLKNESSFVINDSIVSSTTEPYNGDEKLRLVKVDLDYSAQNIVSMEHLFLPSNKAQEFLLHEKGATH